VIKDQNSGAYKHILKVTTVFGGVQLFNIIITVIRSKFIAVLLGPVGIGISGLLNDPLNLIQALTGMGLSKAAVKDVAAAHGSGDSSRISQVITIFRKWVWFTGLLGFATALVFSPLLSKFSFGNQDYTLAFAFLSVTLLLGQISAGQGAVLQGTRQVRYLAKSGMIGSVFGLITSVPLYYLFGVKGIVPAIILTSIATLLLNWYFASKVKVKKATVNRERILTQGKSMLTLGFMMSLSGMVTLGASYLVRIFIVKKGGLADVGLYNAGFAIIGSYVGLIFTAMSMDYYPRLAGVAHNNQQAAKEINEQAEITLLLMAPILCIFLVYINWAVIILYSNKFLGVNSMIQWAAMGMFFKAASWPIGYLFLAKGASKVFFWSELISNVYLLIFNCTGYYWGLTGLGISFLVVYIMVLFQVFFIAKKLYAFKFQKNFLQLFFVQLAFGLACFFVAKTTSGVRLYISGTIVALLSISYSVYEMNKRIGIAGIFNSLHKRFKK
jgi:O-antigen/teichoic acid export membrane protein